MNSYLELECGGNSKIIFLKGGMKKILKPIIQRYLRFLTRLVLMRHKPLIIAVAGTTNKTFIKETILEELGRGPDIRGNPKSFNTEIGLPLAVLFLPSGYSSVFKWVDVLLSGTCLSIFSRKFPKVLVLEMGVDRKNDMKYLLSMVKPKIAVITSIDRSFPDNNTTMDDIAQEMKDLVSVIPEDGAVLLNADDERVTMLKDFAKAGVICYGRNLNADVRLDNISMTDSGQSFDLFFNDEKFSYETQKFGEHNLIAMAVAKVISKEIKKYGVL